MEVDRILWLTDRKRIPDLMKAVQENDADRVAYLVNTSAEEVPMEGCGWVKVGTAVLSMSISMTDEAAFEMAVGALRKERENLVEATKRRLAEIDNELAELLALTDRAPALVAR